MLSIASVGSVQALGKQSDSAIAAAAHPPSSVQVATYIMSWHT